ncbi:hypothetical protein [Halobaculum litoreum]|uniref:DUF8080 domain-containing protein n=1 Tax=Halobaculum litoreum TaxID=3031998 RepID=A0ABD5XLE1_9EURY|nr:hypothetical protein [Halobaculum sp. DT92]
MPVTLDATVSVEAGVALVCVRVRNTEPVDRHVRVVDRLDGDLLPPRRHGRPAPGWSADGYAGVVSGDDERALGYACDLDDPEATPDGGPELVAVTDPGSVAADPVDTARSTLADARPPADAVAPAPDESAGGDPPPERDPGEGGAPSSPTDRTPPSAGESTPAAEPTPADAPTHATDDGVPTVPPGVRRSLDAVERRVERAETLADGSVADATAVVADTDPAALAALVDADAAVAARVADRARALADRAAAVSVPTDELERLA